MSTLFVAIDDTDSLDSPGTGRLARQLAMELADQADFIGVTRHQLLFDSRIPMTAKNSVNVVHLRLDTEAQTAFPLIELANQSAEFVRQKAHPAGDPGLCLAIAPPLAVVEFGYRTKQEIVTATEARNLAQNHQILLYDLGGDGSGIIGALAGAGLASTGNDGRFTWVGRSRELGGVQPVAAILEAGIAAVQTVEGQTLTEGMVDTQDKLRPALIGGEPVLLVEASEGQWRAIRRD